MIDRGHHPDAETIAAFVEGRLEGPALQSITEHLDVCDACAFDTGDAAAFLREESKVVALEPRPFRWEALAAAIVLGLLGIAGWFAWKRTQGPSLIGTMAAAAPVRSRTIEPRLSGGFRWAELRDPVRDISPAADPEQLRLGGAAGEVLQKTAGKSTPDALHAAGVANVVINEPARAIESLRTAAAASSGDPRIWSDLGAAYYLSAIRHDRASELELALQALDRSLASSPSLGEALFNRALVLEKMGRTAEASEAWRKYLAAHPSEEGWSAEATARMEALQGR